MTKFGTRLYQYINGRVTEVTDFESRLPIRMSPIPLSLKEIASLQIGIPKEKITKIKKKDDYIVGEFECKPTLQGIIS